jgi:hypothetical protein
VNAMPCGGDVATSGPRCSYCVEFAFPPYRDVPYPGTGKCLGVHGYRWMALVASEVASERAEQVERVLLWREHTLPVKGWW